MKRAAWFLGCASLATAIAPAGNANAAQTMHVQVNQRGDFAWIGNSSAQDCASTATAPVVGTLNKARAAPTSKIRPLTCSGAPTIRVPGRQPPSSPTAPPTRAARRCSRSPQAP